MKKLSDGTRLILFVSIIIAIFFGVTVLPVVQFNGTAIRMFAPGRLEFSGRGFDGRVLGSHVLETEHGEIVLKNFARVVSENNAISIIYAENFARGRATHNLVVEDIEIPQEIEIVINPHTLQISRLDFARQGLAQYFQEIIVSNVPLSAGRLNRAHPRITANIVIEFLASGYISLMDTTQIYFDPLPDGRPMIRGLYMHKDDEIWKITAGAGMTSVKLPEGTAFVRFRSITFGANWGAFIEGVPFE